jgi:hypothetical protein
MTRSVPAATVYSLSRSSGVTGSLSQSITRWATVCVVARLTSVAIALVGSSPSRWVIRSRVWDWLAAGMTFVDASPPIRPTSAMITQIFRCRRTASRRNRNVTSRSGGNDADRSLSNRPSSSVQTESEVTGSLYG